jgi:hypothetical protein
MNQQNNGVTGRDAPFGLAQSQEQRATDLARSMKSVGGDGIDILKPFAERAWMFRAMGVRLILAPETYDTLKSMGMDEQIIAANSWVVDPRTQVVHSSGQWKMNQEKIAAGIASGELKPNGEKHGFFRTLLMRMRSKQMRPIGTKENFA